MIVVISPAKKLDFETPAPLSEFSSLSNLKKSEQLIQELRKCDAKKVSSLMNLSESLTKLNMQRYQTFKTPFTLKNAKQAIFAFKGDTYVGLDAESLGEKEVLYAQQKLRILSGLYGLVSPLDLIQPYRLEMGTNFSCGQSKNLYEFWRESITQELNELLKDKKVLINCASNEYFKAVDIKKLNATIITPAFKENKNGEFKMVSFFAKRARGMMSRYIIENRLDDPKDLIAFNLDGYKYNKKLSSELEPVFTR